jgi:protein-disulfide isomerase
MRIIWLLLLVLLVPVAARAQSPAPPAASLSAALALTPDDRILGNKDAPITIIEYASLTCPHCAHFAAEVLPKIKEKWIDTGKARLILRDDPLAEPALRAAMIARCAPPQQFYPFVEMLFENQGKWVMSSDYLAALKRLALLDGITPKRVDDCLADKTLEDKIVGSRLSATQQLNVNATPTFFIDGNKFDGDPSFEAVDELLSRRPAKP